MIYKILAWIVQYYDIRKLVPATSSACVHVDKPYRDENISPNKPNKAQIYIKNILTLLACITTNKAKASLHDFQISRCTNRCGKSRPLIVDFVQFVPPSCTRCRDFFWLCQGSRMWVKLSKIYVGVIS